MCYTFFLNARLHPIRDPWLQKLCNSWPPPSHSCRSRAWYSLVRGSGADLWLIYITTHIPYLSSSISSPLALVVLFSLEEAIKRRIRCGCASSLVVAIDIANVHLGLWSSSHSSVTCFLVCKITNQLFQLLATGSAFLQVRAGLVSIAWVG